MKKLIKGEMYYIANPYAETFGTEVQKDRPAIIVSADNETAENSGAIVAFLTTKPKNFSDFRFTLHSSGRPATALIDQMKYVDFGRIGTYLGTLNEEEMAALDECLLKIHGIEVDKYDKLVEALKKEVNNLKNEIAEKDVQIKVYKDMFAGLYATK